ncbi:hypothetical protein THASP1DRAFT_31373 [Thamnocephalis sphaerospora]|uniref:CDP-diacylglycerol--glycerol-3-phosphate 3-phosphatidyltransferase n=1 Tax=Thamnocephalis sphaerospora TaxID=78915 RepID=A0A4P9XLQ8_9FUNG|nr:hypothetical protein THASP1DRAFT_31373 [Thamnocephalis sphaerospora]|eukprot:RKP06813.1 hypothetical protein THASP1DRAFT_31373 [Thamnocephalis sphaerospora]
MHPLGRRLLTHAGQIGLPAFVMRASDVQILAAPGDFYKTLQQRIATARQRITLSALYLGAAERDLVAALDTALARNQQLRVRVLLDYFRGTRQTKGGSSVDLLLPLKQAYPDRVEFSLYRTPDMGRMLGQMAPPRWNETVGVQHTKVAVFDEDVLLTGANLSQDYFTNRQDRYVLFQRSALSSYFDEMVQRLGMLSYRVGEMGPVSPAADARGPDPEDGAPFRRHARTLLDTFTADWRAKAINSTNMPPVNMADGAADHALVIPALQMAPLHVRQDEAVMHGVLKDLCTETHQWRAHLASGYFNLHDDIRARILRTNADWEMIVASPEANGFFKAQDVSRHIPAAYSLIERDFMRDAKRQGHASRFRMLEYMRSGWTFHAKGIWVEPQNDSIGPMLATIGSPNFGYRSFQRDIEAQAWVFSENTMLRQRWTAELDMLRKHLRDVPLEELEGRRQNSPSWVPLATKVIRRMM